MENLTELVEKLPSLKELYQLDKFQILVEFLKSLKEARYSELMDLDKFQIYYPQKVLTLTTELAILGMLIELPLAVQETKRRLDGYKELNQKRTDAQKDTY